MSLRYQILSFGSVGHSVRSIAEQGIAGSDLPGRCLCPRRDHAGDRGGERRILPPLRLVRIHPTGMAESGLRAAFDPLRSLAVVNSKKHVKWAVGLLTLGLVVAAVIYFLAVRDRTFRS